jgi:hypothetical protein
MRKCPPFALAVSLFLLAPALPADPAAKVAPVPVISHIKRLPVESTALATIGYSKRLRALEIEFRNGAIYRYLEVAPSVYRDLMSANSKARYYDQHIRRRFRSLHVKSPSE